MEAFWMAGGHIIGPVKEEKVVQLKTHYYQAAAGWFLGAWAQLYYLKNTADSNVRYASFAGKAEALLWGNDIVASMPLHLEKGLYDIVVSATGTSMHDTF